MVAAKFRPEMVTEVAVDVGRFAEMPLEMTGALKENDDRRVPTVADTVSTAGTPTCAPGALLQ